jgi:GNAT superfamily N-acetyltransferase
MATSVSRVPFLAARDELAPLVVAEREDWVTTHSFWTKPCNDASVLVARDVGGGAIAAFMILLPGAYGYDYVYFVLVASAWRRMGVGRKLVGEALAACPVLSGECGAAAAPFWRSVGARMEEGTHGHWVLIAPGTRFARVMKADERHNDFQFRDGLNVLTQEWKPTHGAGGMYFCLVGDVVRWVEHYGVEHPGCTAAWVREVTLPDDARVAKKASDAYKADRLFLGPKVSISDWFNASPQRTLEAVSARGLALKYVRARTRELCLAAVRVDGMALEWVPGALCTPDVVATAVAQNGLALEFAETHTEELWFSAVRQNCEALRFVSVDHLSVEARRVPLRDDHVASVVLGRRRKLRPGAAAPLRRGQDR